MNVWDNGFERLGQDQSTSDWGLPWPSDPFALIDGNKAIAEEPPRISPINDWQSEF
jgi:hypothetical protein